MSRLCAEPFVLALRDDFRRQNIKAKAAGVPIIYNIGAFVRGLEREIEGRERGHGAAATSGKDVITWAKEGFLLVTYKALLHRAMLQNMASLTNEEKDSLLIKLFTQLYCTDAPSKAEIPTEPQMAAVA